MKIRAVVVERVSRAHQCGILRFCDRGGEGALLWHLAWGPSGRVTAEFVPALGASEADIKGHHALFVAAVVKHAEPHQRLFSSLP